MVDGLIPVDISGARPVFAPNPDAPRATGADLIPVGVTSGQVIEVLNADWQYVYSTINGFQNWMALSRNHLWRVDVDKDFE
jgi:hypothetical protein